jgi:hypothetical protein
LLHKQNYLSRERYFQKFFLSEQTKLEMAEEKKGRYIAYHLNLRDEQMQKLLDGEGILIKKEQLAEPGDDLVYLTKTQINHLERAKKGGKGSRLVMSKTQLKHQATFGSGRFTDFLKRAWDGVKSIGKKAAPVLKKAAKWANEQYGDQAQRLVQDKVAEGLNQLTGKAEQKLVGKVPGEVGKIFDDAIRKGLEMAVTVTNEELRRGLDRGRGALSGQGIFGWIPGIGSTLDDIGNSLWDGVKPVVQGVATNLLAKRLGGAYNSRLLAQYGLDSPTQGRGLFPPGQ